jgi:hypothetical protein
MEATISNLVSQFEKGALRHRQLVRGLAMLAATGTAARAAQNDIDFETTDIDHVSIQVTDLQRSSTSIKKWSASPSLARTSRSESFVLVRTGLWSL